MMGKILIVEDEIALQETLNYNLTNQGYSILTAPNGRDALEIVRKNNPDLIILDVMLPGIDGADSDRVQQVITNLLHNAIKFTSAGGKISATAQISKANQNEVVIEIQDTGQGIADADLPRIFERFYKSDRARTRGQGGTGLGLAIARHIVQAHEGSIWVKSKEGKGSTFYFTLPIAQDSSKDFPTPSSTHKIYSF